MHVSYLFRRKSSSGSRKLADSEGIIDIWNSVVKERIFTMGLNYFNVDDEINFLKSLDKEKQF